MQKRIVTLLCAVCLLATALVPVPGAAAVTGSMINMQFSSEDVNDSGVPNGMSAAGVPEPGTSGAPYVYGVGDGLFGKEASDEVFYYSGEQNGDFTDVGGMTPDIVRNGCFNITSNIDGVDGEIIHFSFEMARDDYEYGGYVEMRPRHADSGTSYPYFNPQAQLWNNTNPTVGLAMFGQAVDPEGVKAKNWNKFDYVFFTKYSPDGGATVYTAVDAYYNGDKVIDKLKLDADMNMAGDQIMTGVNQVRFAYSPVKYYDYFPRSTAFIDNVVCEVLEEEPVIANPELTHTSLTIDNRHRAMTNDDETMTVSGLTSGLPDTYDYAFADVSGRLLSADSTALLTAGNLVVKDKSTGEAIAYYRLEQPEYTEAAPVIDLTFISSDVNAATQIPNGMSGGSLPVSGTENSPYTYGLGSGMYGKSAQDESFWFTTEWADSAFVEAGGISPADLRNACFNIDPNIRNLEENDLIHVSFEIARDDFARGLAAEMRPNHSEFSSGRMPYFAQGNFLNCTNTRGMSVFGQYIDADGIPMENWNRFDYVFFPTYTENGSTYTAVDVYLNNVKVLNKLKLDADANIAGDQLMTGLLQIRFQYGPTIDNGSYPKSTTIIDNLQCGVVKRAPVIEPVTLSHLTLVIDNQRRMITDTDLGTSVDDLINGLTKKYTYSVVDENGQELSGSDFAAPGYLRVMEDGEMVAIYKINQTLSTTLSSDVYTVVRDSINGYAGMTVNEVVENSVVNARSAITAYNADGTAADGSAAAEAGMYLRVTAADNETYMDYVLNHAEQNADEISYIVDGLNSDGSFTNGKLTATVTIDGYAPGVTKDYVFVAAQYQDGRLCGLDSVSKTVSGKASETLELVYDIENLPGTSLQLYLWDGFETMRPVKKSYLIDTRLAGKTMANFGDSITGMGMRSYAENIQKNTGITTINLGIGGAKMANKTDTDIDVLSMAETMRALTTPDFDWSRQDAYAASSGQNAIVEHVKNMKNLDLSTLDYASIWFGTNDFTANVVLDNPDDPYDVTTFGGALRYSLDKLLEANPDLKIMLITPMYRDRQIKESDNPYIADGKNSDDYPNNNGVYLTEYGDKIKGIAANYGENVMVLDMYVESGINRYNHQKYFYDGLHPSGEPESVGNRLLGSKFADFIVRNF